jgi:hypothetical protein
VPEEGDADLGGGSNAVFGDDDFSDAFVGLSGW